MPGKRQDEPDDALESESKGAGGAGEAAGESKGGGGKREEPILDKTLAFLASSDFESEFEEWAREHVGVFESAIDEETGAEQKLEFYSIYQEYLGRFEGRIQKFIEAEGSSIEQFQAECDQCLRDDNNPNRFLVDVLLATTEYNMFVSLMKGEARRHFR